MSPGLRDGDVLLAHLGAAVRPGDVVLVRWESRPGQLSVKRAVAPVDAGGRAWEVRGDNPFGGTDSGQLGPALVVGVARARLWPSPCRLG